MDDNIIRRRQPASRFSQHRGQSGALFEKGKWRKGHNVGAKPCPSPYCRNKQPARTGSPHGLLPLSSMSPKSSRLCQGGTAFAVSKAKHEGKRLYTKSTKSLAAENSFVLKSRNEQSARRGTLSGLLPLSSISPKSIRPALVRRNDIRRL